MMTSKSLRILVSGDVEGNFSQLFSRINSIQKKSGAFDLLLCVGDFFGNNVEEWQEYKQGSKKVPIPTLILGPNKSEQTQFCSNSEGSDLCENVTYLGKRGMFTGSSGLQLAYLSGIESSTNVSDDTHFSGADYLALTQSVINDSKFKGVDILITSQWPREVDKYGIELEELDCKNCGSETVSQLALAMKPRYHFCGMEGVHYERQPYRNHKVLAEGARHVTRFISLAKVGNTKKKKYLYAFNITPLKHLPESELTNQPQDTTECPYKARIMQTTQQVEESSQFFYDMKSRDGGDRGRKRPSDGGRGPQEKRQKKHPQPTGPCWFCLSSPQVEKHLAVSVGTETYLALAKGGLVPEHILILPIGHYQSTVSAPSEVLEEIDKYKSALKKCFKKQGKATVFFERNYKTQHLQIQVVPIPEDCVQDIKDAFIEGADSFDLDEIPKHSDIKQIVPVGAPYFYAELPTGEKLLHRIKHNFPLQFGREVLASPEILNMPERSDWKVCSLSQDEEAQLAKDFKAIFRPFDFTLD